MWKYTGQKRPGFADSVASGQESVWDYPRPPVCLKEKRTIRVESKIGQLACTNEAIKLCETASPPQYYLPREDINMSLLTLVPGSSHCEWKGVARYWGIKGGSVAVAWDYPSPAEPYLDLAGCLAFYPSRLACFVDDEPVVPQPGEFYGGWITNNLAGPFKGGPGTGHW